MSRVDGWPNWLIILVIDNLQRAGMVRDICNATVLGEKKFIYSLTCTIVRDYNVHLRDLVEHE